VAFTDSSGRTKSSMADINITPLVDVVLVLLVIFMLTAPVLQSGIDVAVPKTRTVREATEQHEVITIDRYAHLVGGARMAADERHGVVDRNCRSFAVPNLYITDGSVLPTQGSANPALTIMAVAARAADHLIAGASGGTT